MALIRPNAEPAATSVAVGDIFLIDGATGVRALAATAVPIRDTNANIALNNSILGYTTTATAAATTTLTAASTWAQYFTGATTQTVVLPVVSTLALDHSFYIQNSSTGALTVNSSGGNLVTTVAAGASALVSCILITGTTAASWSAKYHAALVASGKVLTVNNTLTLAGIDGTTMTFPGTSATIARTDAGQTFTGTNVFGVITATSLNGLAVTTSTGTLTIANLKTLTANNSLTLAGTDATTMTFPTTSATIARTDAANTFTGHQTIEGVTSTGATGTGNLVFATTPTLTTPVLGVATATSINGNTITTGTGVLTIGAAKTLTVSNTLTLAGTDGTTQTFQASDTIVGRTTTDTLTNKTISGAANTLTVRLANDVSGTLPVANGGTAYTGGAWTAYTATVTPGAGSITTQASASSFLQIGKLVHVRISVSISNIGTASGSMGVNLPVAAASGSVQNLWGRESANSGNWISGTVTTSGTNLDVRTSANASFGFLNGQQIVFVGVYEAL